MLMTSLWIYCELIKVIVTSVENIKKKEITVLRTKENLFCEKILIYHINFFMS